MGGLCTILGLIRYRKVKGESHRLLIYITSMTNINNFYDDDIDNIKKL